MIIGPKEDRRLAFRVLAPAEGWVSVSYPVTVPSGARLAFSISGEPGQIFQVMASGSNGDEELLFQRALSGKMRISGMIMRSYWINM